MESKDKFICAVAAALQAYCASTTKCKWCEVRNYCPLPAATTASEWHRIISKELDIQEDSNEQRE